MFNGYHEPSATSYDFELDRGKKNQGVSKWACENGTSIQSTHLHPQNQQSDIWVSKSPFIGLPNSASPKCNCPSCYQLPESQSYQGEIPWHRSWLPRTYPVPTHDLVKLPGNHQWENGGLPSESYAEQVGGQFVQDGGEKPLFYKSYSGLRHDIYQPGVISTVKKVARKQELPKQDEVVPNVGHHGRYPPSVSNPGYESFRTAMDQRLIEERTNYCNETEKFMNANSCRQQGGLGPYGLNPNRRTILESFSKTVPSNANQNRVPSVGHHTIKDNDFHTCIDQNDIVKTGPYVNHEGADEKHCRIHMQPDVNLGQENLHAGLMNSFSCPTDYHSINLNRDMPSGSDKFINGRTQQYFPRNNISDVVTRSPNTMLNYDNRKGVISIPSGSARAAQTPPKHAEIVSKSPNFGKDCIVREKISTGQKLVVNNSMKISSERFHQGNEIGRSENILHGHITRPVMEANLPEKGYNSMSPQNTLYKGYRRAQEYTYTRRNIQRPFDNPSGLMNVRSDITVGVTQGAPNLPDIRKSTDAYPRANSAFPPDGSLHMFEKLHYQLSGDSTPQSSLFVGSQFPPKLENLRETEKESPSRISHLEAIPYEELCKNGTSKISPLRLLRKKKLIHQKEDVPDASTADAAAKVRSASPPLDVRRFWATWAEEEEDSVPQTQMVVLDCHSIDPEQAGLLHFYNPENIRTVNLEGGNVLDIKGTGFEKVNDQGAFTNGKEANYEKASAVPESDSAVMQSEVKMPVSSANIGKIQSSADFSLGVPIILDPVKEITPDVESKTNVIVQPNHFGRIVQNQPSDDGKQFDDLNHETKSNVESPVLTQADEEMKGTEEGEGHCDAVSKEESISSYSSDDSQTGNLPTFPDLPTSEYRKNKFLDYSEDGFCNGLMPEGANKEVQCRKHSEESECQVEDKLKDFLTSKPSDIGPGSFEIDDILKKLSDINFQGVATGSPALSDSPEKHKTDKKVLESRKEKKTKKQSHKSSRTDEVTLQNISLTKPTIKFSIQKSHDLKISFKVLNNKKKHEENSDEEDDAASDDGNQGNRSPEGFEDGEIANRLKKNKRRLITLKLKGVSEGNDSGSVWDEDLARKSKKGLKKKKVRWERSPSPKTPVLKIKKSRYMMTYGCESEEVRCNGTIDDTSKSSECESMAHGDFQVHETVDSAKIKLTFKRNKNKDKWSDNDDMVDVRSENEPADLNDSCLKTVAAAESSLDYEITTPCDYVSDEKEDQTEESSYDSTVRGGQDLIHDEISADSQRSLVGDPETPSHPDEDMVDDLKKEDIIVEPLEVVNSRDDAAVPDESNSPLREHPKEEDRCEISEREFENNIPETKNDSAGSEVDVLAVGEEVEKSTEELDFGGREDDDFGGNSEVNDTTESKEITNKPNEDNSVGDMLICGVRKSGQSDRDPLETLLENKSEENAVNTEKVVDKYTTTNADEEAEKHGNPEEEERQYSGEYATAPETSEGREECDRHTADSTQDVQKHETTVVTEQKDVDFTENSDGMVLQNCTDEPPLTSDSHCELNVYEAEADTITESAEQPDAEIRNSLEQPIIEVDTGFVEWDNQVRDLESVPVNGTVDDSASVSIRVNDEGTGVTDMEVEDLGTQENSCEIEQKPKLEQPEPLTKETASEDDQTNGDAACQDSPEHAVEDKNNNIRHYLRETVFVRRNILRRRSCEDMKCEQESKKKREAVRSTSLNIELTIVEEPETAMLDIDVSNIPLPPGDAPPENCLNFEEYFKSKQAKTVVLTQDVKEITSPRVLEYVSKPVSTVVQDTGESPNTEQIELVPGNSVPCNTADEPGIKVEQRQSDDESMIKNVEKIAEAPAMEKDEKDAGHLPTAEEIRIEDLEVFGTGDTDITLDESTFRAEHLYECEGLAFDEALTISDDMEEKVSDDDKFRNIMQNCLDNAKKFLSVGNLKIVDDLLQVDVDEDVNKSDSHVSKDVLLTSCDESDDLILSNSRHQSLDLLDLVPNFCPDIGTNPCSEILPVDNWPYLEEEVASSPLRNKVEDTDMLCFLNNISSSENLTSESEFPVGKLNRRHRGSLHYDSKRNSRPVNERRRTIEGIGPWKAFQSSEEDLSDTENIIRSGDKRKTTEIRQSKNCVRKMKDRMKPFSDSEGMSAVKKGCADYKSSSWQPRVVLFRISKNTPSVLANKSSEVQINKPAAKDVDVSRVSDRGQTISLRKDGEHQSGTGADGRKRKKSRFRNLHTNKRIVPQTKESRTWNDSNLVDSESDSNRSSPSSDPPKEIVCSHNKSTKASPIRKSKDEDSRIRKNEKIPERYKEKRKRDASNVEDRSKRKKSIEETERPKNMKYLRDSEKRHWMCEVCGFSKSSERATHIQSHPFHCQSCHLAFKTEAHFLEHLTRKHKDIRNQHHCLLCELSFDLEKDYYRHLETREHRHLESVEKNTINTLFRLLTGQPCPVLGPIESKPEWLPTQAGTVHFYHQATPLSLALQYLKLHHDKKKLSSEASE